MADCEVEEGVEDLRLAFPSHDEASICALHPTEGALGLKPWHGLLDGSSSSSFAAWPPSLGHLRTDSAPPDVSSQLVGIVSLVTSEHSNPLGWTTDSTGLDLDGIDEGKDLLSFIAVCCSDG